LAANGYSATSSQQVVATPTAQTIPTAGPTLRIINLGKDIAYVATGATSPVAVTPLTGLAIQPGGPPEFLTAGAYLGVCTGGEFQARLNISNGT
jgi:hypothetical protein